MATISSDVEPVRETGGRLADDLRGIRVVWRRELIRFLRNRARIVTWVVQPLLFLLVLGTGLARMMPSGDGTDFRTFVYPGVLAMAVLLTSIFSAVSIVWDREFGFMREMLVAPVRRGALVVGKCLGGATVATMQGAIMLTLAGLAHVPYTPSLLGVLLLEMALTSLALTAIGTMVAARAERIETFQVVIQLMVLPMFFLSGALFPLSGLPTWLKALTLVDPLSYAVDPLRRAVFTHVPAPAGLSPLLDAGVTWGGWRLPTWFELCLVAMMALVALAIASHRFSRTQ